MQVTPKNIIVLPVLFESQVKAVIELSSLADFTDLEIAFLEQLTANIGIVLNCIEATMQTEGLLKQSQQLAGELQTQQKELQQTNEQLEQKARELAEQNVEVERKNQEIEQARRALEEKATELALTSKYKSEFLANMCHELRTPLNCILILGQQLADNPDQNLTAKQVDFARTIHGAGTDLLNLISDILDLSKIESGTVTVDAEEIGFANVIEAVARPFRHEAEARQLGFEVTLDPSAGPHHADRLQAAAAGAEEPALQRLQIHRPGRGAACRCSAVDEGWNAGHPVLGQAGQCGGVRSLRHRHRHPGGKAEADLRGLPAGRRLHQPQIWRHRPGPGHQPRTVQPAGRRNPAAQHAGRGQHLQALSAACAMSARPRRPARPRPRPCRLLCRALPERVVEQIAGRPRRSSTPGDTVLLIVEDDPHYARILMDLAHDEGFKVLVGDAAATTRWTWRRNTTPPPSRSISSCPTCWAGRC